jgi:hypothetical protein
VAIRSRVGCRAAGVLSEGSANQERSSRGALLFVGNVSEIRCTPNLIIVVVVVVVVIEDDNDKDNRGKVFSRRVFNLLPNRSRATPENQSACQSRNEVDPASAFRSSSRPCSGCAQRAGNRPRDRSYAYRRGEDHHEGGSCSTRPGARTGSRTAHRSRSARRAGPALQHGRPPARRPDRLGARH